MKDLLTSGDQTSIQQQFSMRNLENKDQSKDLEMLSSGFETITTKAS